MQTIFDPKAARYFAGVLQDQSRAVAQQNAAIARRLVELRTTWRDKKYDQFERTFDEATKQLAQFLEHADRYAQYLQKKAAVAEKYLNGR